MSNKNFIGAFGRLICISLVIFVTSDRVASSEEEDEPSTGPEVANRQPQVNTIFPMAARPGEALRFEIQGEFLDRSSGLLFEGGDISGKVTSSTFTSAEVELTVASDAVPGPRRLRLASPRGVSNAVLIRVSRWPTLLEKEPNDEPESATPIQAPVLISARLQTGEEVDLYRFHASAGERLQFNVLGARIGTNADVSLAILRPDGREIVHDEGRFIWDPYLDYTFDKEGDYLAAVTLTRMPAGGQPRTDLNYQMAIGRSPFLWSLFPLGIQRGASVELKVRGDFLERGATGQFSERGLATPSAAILGGALEPNEGGDYRLPVKVASDAPLGPSEFALKDESGTLAPLVFVVGELPEIMEQEPNDTQTQAQPLAGAVVVNGVVDRNGDEDWFRLSVGAGTSWLFNVDAEKYGSMFDSFLTLLNEQEKVVASNDDAKWLGRALNRDSQITMMFKEAGTYWIKVSSLYRRGGPEHVYRLTVRPSEPDFMISLTTDRPSVVPGHKGKIGISLSRLNEFKGDVVARIQGLPRGVQAEPLVLTGDKESGSIELVASAEAELGAVQEIQVTGTAMIDSKEVKRRALLPPGRFQGSGPAFADSSPLKAFLAVVEPAQFSLESAASTVYLVRGGTAEFGVKVTRQPGFAAELQVTAENLPKGISIEDVELIDEGRMARVTVKAAADAKPAKVPNVAIIGNAAWDGKSYQAAAPRISLQVD